MRNEERDIPDAKILERQAKVLHPGGWAVEGERPLATVLGSCVAVCLHDPHQQLSGMNHFMLPQRHHAHTLPEDPDTVLAGDYAMEVLVNAMMAHGCRKQHLQAKAFGGGTVVHSLHTMIGENNARFAQSWLQREGIPLLAEDLGGPWSRKVIALPNGDVFCRRLSAQTEVLEPALEQVLEQEWRWQERQSHAAPASKTKNIELF